MTSVETLESKIDNLTIRMEENFKSQDEKIDMVKEFFKEKVEHTDRIMNTLIERCNSCPLQPRVEKIETNIDRLNIAYYFALAIAIIAGIIIPYVLPKVF